MPRSPKPVRSAALQPLAAKVPEVTVVFWAIKVLTTGMGEAAADYLGEVSIVLAGLVGVLGLALALTWQFRAREYVAARYWSAVAMVAVFGTMVADGPHVVLGLPYPVSTLLYVALVAACFLVWRRREGTLSIHSITTRRRETFYWVTVLATFALGTALGDLTAMVWHLGFFWSGVVFAALIAVPAIGWARFGLNPVVAFWAAYVLTRPLGASFADWAGKPHSVAGGLGLGDGAVTLVTGAFIIGLVAWCAVTRRDVQRPVSASAGRAAEPDLDPAAAS
jgi:uncharacterized membrane-anchored protein